MLRTFYHNKKMNSKKKKKKEWVLLLSLPVFNLKLVTSLFPSHFFFT